MSSLGSDDRYELAQLGVLYGHRFDAGDGPGWAALFASDGCFTGPDDVTVSGAEALAAVPPAALARIPGMRHLPGPMALEVDGEQVRGRSYGQAVQVAGPQTLTLIVAGEYDDVFCQGPDGWRFAHRRFTAW